MALCVRPQLLPQNFIFEAGSGCIDWYKSEGVHDKRWKGVVFNMTWDDGEKESIIKYWMIWHYISDIFVACWPWGSAYTIAPLSQYIACYCITCHLWDINVLNKQDFCLEIMLCQLLGQHWSATQACSTSHPGSRENWQMQNFSDCYHHLLPPLHLQTRQCAPDNHVSDLVVICMLSHLWMNMALLCTALE